MTRKEIENAWYQVAGQLALIEELLKDEGEPEKD